MVKTSVILPVYNRANFIGESIHSVLDQTYTDFELVVVDDDSTDNTQEVVESFQDPRISYVYQENQGVSAAQNTGTDVSVGEYICGLGSDDMYHPMNLELKVRILDSCPGVGLVGSFDESLPTHEDWDLFIRIAQRFATETVDVPLLKLRKHDANLTASWDNMYQGAVTILNRAMKSYSFSGAELRLIEKRLARTHFSYGKSLVADGMASLGREKLFAGIKINPWSVKPYIYLAWSLLGNELILSLKSIKNRLGNFILRKPTSIKTKI